MSDPQRPSTDGILNAQASGSRLGGPSFSLRHRAERALWGIAWTLLASWTPPPLHRWRVGLLRLFGARIASGSRIYGSTKVWYPRNLVIGTNAVMGPGVTCYSMGPITIGDNATISQRSHLCAGTHNVDDPDFQLMAFPIVVGAEAWIAAEAFVGPGVVVGTGAVLGARAVTVKNLEPWTIYAGNPARKIRARVRFDQRA